MGPYSSEKPASDDVIRTKECYYVKSNFLNLKHYVCQIFLPSF